MTDEERVRWSLHYIDALTRSVAVESIDPKERANRIIKACDYIEKMIMA